MITQKQKMKMQQKLTPQQLMLMRLLQLPVTRLEQRIKEEVEKNPMLEVDSEESLPDNAEQTDRFDMGDTDDEGDFRGLDMDDYFDDDDYSYRERLERDRNTAERRVNFSEDEDFSASLVRQLNLQNLDDRQRAIGIEIIGSIDGSGYLGRDLALIANDLAFRSGIDADDREMEQMLAVVQSLDPAGVGARTLQECLSLQLHRSGQSDESLRDAIEIVDNHFERLGSKHYETLMETMKIDEARLRRALDAIRRLNPKPGWGREEEHKGAHYILPDFVVSRDGDHLTFRLNDNSANMLHLNAEYSAMQSQLGSRKKLSADDRETLNFIKTKSEEAQWFIDTLQQRQVTMTEIMSAIVEHQYRYFLTGDSADMRPMLLKDIAAKSGYDESTVSRVVNQKYVQTDYGTLLLRDLFTKAVVTEQGDVMVTDHVKRVMQEIIDQEDKAHPLTDESLAKELQERGIKLSRRTVTKYRESMGVAVGRLRKELKDK